MAGNWWMVAVGLSATLNLLFQSIYLHQAQLKQMGEKVRRGQLTYWVSLKDAVEYGDPRLQRNSSALESLPYFCTTANLQSAVVYLSQELQGMGLGCPFIETEGQRVNIVALVNGCWEVTQLYRTSVRDSNALQDQHRRSTADMNHFQISIKDLRGEVNEKERLVGEAQEKERRTTLDNKSLAAKLKMEKEEVRRLGSVMQQREAQYQHELKKKERALLHLTTEGWEIAFQWVSSHAGIPGNEVADSAAKLALTEVNTTPFPLLLSADKRLISRVCRSPWNNTFGDALRITPRASTAMESNHLQDRLHRLLSCGRSSDARQPSLSLSATLSRANRSRAKWKTEASSARHEEELYKRVLGHYEMWVGQLNDENDQLKSSLLRITTQMTKVVTKYCSKVDTPELPDGDMNSSMASSAFSTDSLENLGTNMEFPAYKDRLQETFNGNIRAVVQSFEAAQKTDEGSEKQQQKELEDLRRQ
ncbi:Afadin- and alpha-actinin-binding protein [Chionoecetes opilio]|uniref:Afadin- and alpha-actinin-binding protein n=1 Tax=Chionoecetes opilio TaxID=41210 RepID=A0A8J4Y9V7_CHIOP|nr:Afadin- and alpha-actinin-binding protein [Chionoecetes opilio]KAG0720269.1 Afadin- and alpha-actinin-binding protein [Chionoecetes opilio]